MVTGQRGEEARSSGVRAAGPDHPGGIRNQGTPELYVRQGTHDGMSDGFRVIFGSGVVQNREGREGRQVWGSPRGVRKIWPACHRPPRCSGHDAPELLFLKAGGSDVLPAPSLNCTNRARSRKKAI